VFTTPEARGGRAIQQLIGIFAFPEAEDTCSVRMLPSRNPGMLDPRRTEYEQLEREMLLRDENVIDEYSLTLHKPTALCNAPCTYDAERVGSPVQIEAFLELIEHERQPHGVLQFPARPDPY
jgi:hypothetical protein